MESKEAISDSQLYVIHERVMRNQPTYWRYLIDNNVRPYLPPFIRGNVCGEEWRIAGKELGGLINLAESIEIAVFATGFQYGVMDQALKGDHKEEAKQNCLESEIDRFSQNRDLAQEWIITITDTGYDLGRLLCRPQLPLFPIRKTIDESMINIRNLGTQVNPRVWGLKQV